MAKRDPGRDRRLAEALRQNLRRRKAQGRELTEESSRRKPGPMDTEAED